MQSVRQIALQVVDFDHVEESNLASQGYLQDDLGKQKVPTLRNVDQRPTPGFAKAFMHNGALKTLKESVHFYNTRDIKPTCAALDTPKPGDNCWLAPEVAANVNMEELGDLGLTEAEEQAIVAFMRALSDGWGEEK